MAKIKRINIQDYGSRFEFIISFDNEWNESLLINTRGGAEELGELFIKFGERLKRNQDRINK